MRAELLPQSEVTPLVEEMQIHLAEGREETVRIIAQQNAAIAERDLQSIRERCRTITEEQPKEPVLVALHRPALLTQQHNDGCCIWLEGANRNPVHTIKGDRMRAQQVMRQGGFASNEPPRGVG